MAKTNATSSLAAAPIHVGVGGWTFPPWRDNFYPKGLPQAEELAYAGRKLTAIEINATYYRLQSAKSFAKWRDSVPEGFVFSVKGSQYVTNRRVLGEAGEAIARFMASGVAELGAKLGPFVWQFATTKVFDEADFASFLALLPNAVAGVPARHAVEVRHRSFMVPAFVALARERGVAIVFADSETHPSFADRTAKFVYARLMRTSVDEPTGYSEGAITGWADVMRAWSTGADPKELPHVEVAASATPTDRAPREVFAFYISGAKERAPAAAMATLDALQRC